jgi:putative transposase
LQIAPSGYHRHAAQLRNPALRFCRARRDDTLIPEIQRLCDANMQCYGAVKVWKQLGLEGIGAARCTVERLMRRAGLQGIRRGRVVRTTVAGDKSLCPLDRVQRQFYADRPNQPWVSDFTYVSTWQGWLYVAFAIDVFARRIVGWRVSTSMKTDFVLDVLEQRCMPASHIARGPDPPQRSWQPVWLDPLHRETGRGRHRALGW